MVGVSARSGWRVNTGELVRDRFRAVPRTDTPTTSPTPHKPKGATRTPTNPHPRREAPDDGPVPAASVPVVHARDRIAHRSADACHFRPDTSSKAVRSRRTPSVISPDPATAAKLSRTCAAGGSALK